ncbi:MAG: prolyl oligopeptidase family serine peptidase [Candidatus Aminicenantes bacterium]
MITPFELPRSIKEHYYEYEVPDILSGIDHLIDQGMVDPDKVAVMGWRKQGRF